MLLCQFCLKPRTRSGAALKPGVLFLRLSHSIPVRCFADVCAQDSGDEGSRRPDSGCGSEVAVKQPIPALCWNGAALRDPNPVAPSRCSLAQLGLSLQADGNFFWCLFLFQQIGFVLPTGRLDFRSNFVFLSEINLQTNCWWFLLSAPFGFRSTAPGCGPCWCVGSILKDSAFLLCSFLTANGNVAVDLLTGSQALVYSALNWNRFIRIYSWL